MAATYDRALGMRGIQRLLSYRQDTYVYGNKAHAMTAEIQNGTLTLHTSHISRLPNEELETFTIQLRRSR